MCEFDIVLAIPEKEADKQTRKFIHRLASRKLGAPDEPTVTRLEGITDIDCLDHNFDRAMNPDSWQDLLDTPGGGPIRKSRDPSRRRHYGGHTDGPNIPHFIRWGDKMLRHE